MITKSKIFKQNRQTKTVFYKTKFLRLERYIKRDNFPIDAIKYHKGKSWNEAEEILKGMLESKLGFTINWKSSQSYRPTIHQRRNAYSVGQID